MSLLDKTPALTRTVLSAMLFFLSTGSLYAQSNYTGTDSEPDGVDNMLTYPEGMSNLTYHTGGKRPFLISYGSNIDPSTFVAVLNEKDATNSFSPSPNTTETVYLHLKRGGNSLQISVNEKQYTEEELPNYLEINALPTIDTDEFSIQLKGPKASVLFEATPIEEGLLVPTN